MKAIIPRTFRQGGMVDGDDVNDNLLSLQRDTNRSLDQRYTYCTVVIPIDGVVDTDTAAERTVPFQRATIGGTLLPVDIVGMELSVYASATATWTATVTDENGRTVVLSVDGSTAGEAYDVSNVPLQLDSATRLDFVLAGDAASTVTRGTLTLTVRADRLQQADVPPARYTPTLVDVTTNTAGSTMDAQLAAAEDAVEADAARAIDLRCVCVMANDLSAAQVWRLPSGAGATGLRIQGSAVGTATRSVAVGDGTNTLTLNTTGTSNIVVGNESLASKSDDPTDTTDDLVITLTPTGGAISRVFVFLWWS